MLSPAAKILRWCFFCDGYQSPSVPGRRPGVQSSSDRWRMLAWSVALTSLWTKAECSINTFFSLLGLVVTVSLAINVLTLEKKHPGFPINGIAVLTLVVCLVTALALVTSHPVYLSYEYLAKKIFLREYNMWIHRCPYSYAIVVAVICITCVMRGIHTRIFPRWKRT